MSVFFNEEPSIMHETFIPPLPSCIQVIKSKAQELVPHHAEYGIAGSALAFVTEECHVWMSGTLLGNIGSILCLTTGFARCLSEAQDKADAKRAGQLFNKGLRLLKDGQSIEEVEMKLTTLGLYSTLSEDELPVYTYSAGAGSPPRDIKAYVGLMRRAGEIGPREAFPALQSCCGACDSTADNWICAASAPLDVIAYMLLALVCQMRGFLHRTHKAGAERYAEMILFKPMQAVWRGMPVRDALRAVREGTR